MADTLADPQAVWGDVLRIDRVDEEVVAERGFLFVSSANLAWLLVLDPANASFVEVMPATRLQSSR